MVSSTFCKTEQLQKLIALPIFVRGSGFSISISVLAHCTQAILHTKKTESKAAEDGNSPIWPNWTDCRQYKSSNSSYHNIKSPRFLPFTCFVTCIQWSFSFHWEWIRRFARLSSFSLWLWLEPILTALVAKHKRLIVLKYSQRAMPIYAPLCWGNLTGHG